MENPDHPLFEGESLLKMNVKAIFEVSSPWISEPQEKAEECDLKKIKT